jgi:hypothetical protein
MFRRGANANRKRAQAVRAAANGNVQRARNLNRAAQRQQIIYNQNTRARANNLNARSDRQAAVAQRKLANGNVVGAARSAVRSVALDNRADNVRGAAQRQRAKAKAGRKLFHASMRAGRR